MNSFLQTVMSWEKLFIECSTTITNIDNTRNKESLRGYLSIFWKFILIVKKSVRSKQFSITFVLGPKYMQISLKYLNQIWIYGLNTRIHGERSDEQTHKQRSSLPKSIDIIKTKSIWNTAGCCIHPQKRNIRLYPCTLVYKNRRKCNTTFLCDCTENERTWTHKL